MEASKSATFFASTFYHDAVAHAPFQRLRITTAYIQERKHSTQKPWREIMKDGGFKNLEKAFFNWVHLERERRFTHEMANALEMDLGVLQATIALDKIEWEKERERNPSIFSYQWKAMPTMYPVSKLPEGISCEDALEVVRKIAIERKCRCVCESSVALYFFDHAGNIKTYPYEPRLDIGTDYVVING